MSKYVPLWIEAMFPGEGRIIANPLKIKAACRHAREECGPEVEPKVRARVAWMMLARVMEFIDMIPSITNREMAKELYWHHLTAGAFESVARYTRKCAAEYRGDGEETSEWYSQYLKSEHWRLVKLEVYDHYGPQCRTCCRTEQMNVHHRHYDTLYRESVVDDLVPLCYICHGAIHDVHDIFPPRNEPTEFKHLARYELR